MIELKPSPLAYVSPGVPALLQTGYYVKFSDAWPSNLGITYQDAGGKTRGKFFQINRVNQVTHDLSYIIPSGDFRDVDFSNVVSAFNENLYPTSPNTLYEISMGFKPANLLAHFYIPAGEYVSRLEQAGMIPNVASATLRYLGAKKPEDSPYDDKRIFIYTVFNMEPFIMRLFVDSGLTYLVAGVSTPAFDKVIPGLVVNKCLLTWITDPDQNMQNRAKEIKYYSELRW
jgi:hypothetical protein